MTCSCHRLPRRPRLQGGILEGGEGGRRGKGSTGVGVVGCLDSCGFRVGYWSWGGGRVGFCVKGPVASNSHPSGSHPLC